MELAWVGRATSVLVDGLGGDGRRRAETRGSVVVRVTPRIGRTRRGAGEGLLHRVIQTDVRPVGPQSQ